MLAWVTAADKPVAAVRLRGQWAWRWGPGSTLPTSQLLPSRLVPTSTSGTASPPPMAAASAVGEVEPQVFRRSAWSIGTSLCLRACRAIRLSR